MNAIRFQSTTIRPTQSPVNNPAPVPPANVDYNEPIANVDINEIDLTNKVLEDLGPQVRLHAAEDVSKLDGMVPTTSQLQAEFNKLAGDKKIPFEYIINGCFARAHLMLVEPRAP